MVETSGPKLTSQDETNGLEPLDACPAAPVQFRGLTVAPNQACCCRLIHGMTVLEIFIVERRRAVEVSAWCGGRAQFSASLCHQSRMILTAQG